MRSRADALEAGGGALQTADWVILVLVAAYHLLSFLGVIGAGARRFRRPEVGSWRARRSPTAPRPRTRQRRVHLLRAHLARGRCREVTGGWLVSGQHRGRDVSLWIPEEPGTLTSVRLKTSSDLRLRVSPGGGGGPREVELEGGEAQQARAALALRDPSVTSALGVLFEELGVSGVRLAGGEVSLERATSDPELAPPRVDRVLDLLRRLAKRFEVASDAVEAPRVSIRSATAEAARCPFCRDDLDPAEGGVVACAECRTQHHDACFEELGRCTTHACGSAESWPVLLEGPEGAPVVRVRLERCERCGSRRRGCSAERCRAPRRLRDRRGRDRPRRTRARRHRA